MTNQRKTVIRTQITADVNEVGTAQRTVEKVRNKWRNVYTDSKSKLVQHMVEHKKNKSGTDGPAPAPLSDSDMHLLDMYSDSVSF